MVSESDNTVTLKEYLCALLEQQEARMGLRFDAMDKALEIANRELSLRLERLNELREEVTRDRASFVKIGICSGHHENLQKWQDTVNRKLTVLETRSITWTAAVGVFFLILNVVMKYYGK